MQDPAKILLTLYNGIIAARRFRWVSGGLIGISAMQTDGSTRLYAVDEEPTKLIFLGLDENILCLPYNEIKKILLTKLYLMDELDELPWLNYDKDGLLAEGQVEAEAVVAWLKSKVSIDDDGYENWGAQSASEYAPGFEIMCQLSHQDIENLGLREVDLGGPASSVPAVAIQATVDEFNSLMNLRKLPYFAQDCEMGEEY